MYNFFVYILRCSDNSYYVGHTDNLEKRISEHTQGTYPGYVASRLPAHLVFQETFTSRDEALSAEHQIKKWSRAKKEALISGGWERMHGICRKIKLDLKKKYSTDPSTCSRLRSNGARDERKGG